MCKFLRVILRSEVQVTCAACGGDVILMHDALGPGALRNGCPETVALTELLLATAERAELTTATVSESEGVLA